METSPGEVTNLLIQLKNGNQEAESRLVPLVYAELRRLAARYMRGERPGHTLQATALVHEAYLRLAGEKEIDWQNRAHFFAVAAKLMRRILVDHARAKRARKRGGADQNVTLDEAIVVQPEPRHQFLVLDEALQRLAERDPRQARIVELRYFAGLSEEEAADVLGISVRTVKRDWSVARAWLYQELNPPCAST
ncbi:MAG TPA: sigma-70 family RNA polymerase sigma factor [Terriglobia bacterium]|nr:sigma-70 family RNA polymerase sigma factor [Terriglobia bacterium]